METIKISYRKKSELKNLKLPTIVTNTESFLYPINIGKNWRKEPKILKEFRPLGKTYISNKLATLNNLMEYRSSFSTVPELVLPEKLAFIERKEIGGGISEHLGYIMPYIKENINLVLILQRKDIDIKEKITYLKMIGSMLNRLQKIKILGEGFYLSDMHEGNFLWDFDNEMLRVVDLDSSKLAGSYPFASKYLEINKVIKRKELESKYLKNYKGEYLPNNNTELLCFVTMILNTIGNGKVTNLKYEEFYSYLAHLIDNGFSYNLVDAFASIYQAYDTVDPTKYLDEIPNNVENVRLDDFVKRIRK